MQFEISLDQAQTKSAVIFATSHDFPFIEITKYENSGLSIILSFDNIANANLVMIKKGVRNEVKYEVFDFYFY